MDTRPSLQEISTANRCTDGNFTAYYKAGIVPDNYPKQHLYKFALWYVRKMQEFRELYGYESPDVFLRIDVFENSVNYNFCKL